MAEELGIPFLGQIPIVQGIREGGDQGVPTAASSESITGKVFKGICDKVIQSIEGRNENRAPTQKIKVERK